MSPDGPSRRGVALGAFGMAFGAFGALALAGCGFAPALGPGTPGARLRGRVAVEAPSTPDGYRLRRRLLDRLGEPDVPAATLSVALDVTATAAAVTPDGAITRTELTGRAAWRLEGADGAALGSGEARGFTGASATGPTVATRAAAEDARERLMVLLADEIVAALLLLPPDGPPGAPP